MHEAEIQEGPGGSQGCYVVNCPQSVVLGFKSGPKLFLTTAGSQASPITVRVLIEL